MGDKYDLIPPLSMDPVAGMFGWLAPENFLYNFLVMGAFCRYGVMQFYTLALYFFSTVIVANLFMLEPILGQVIGVILG